MTRIRMLLSVMLACISWVSMRADFDPANPPEPNDIYVYKHDVTVVASPDRKGYTTGTGRYKEGTVVTISTSSAEANWHFKMWLVDGVEDTAHRSTSFRYTVGQADVTFTAVYEYKEPETPEDPDPPVLPPFEPSDPGEPEVPTFPEDPTPPVEPPTPPAKYKLTLVSGPFEASSFNTSSGRMYTEGTTVALNTYGNQYFYFNGWFDEDANLVSTTPSFTYTMPDRDMTLIASWRFDPDSPADPTGNQDNVDNPHHPGDVNQDQNVSILDVMLTVSQMLGNPQTGFDMRTADINGDGRITIFDVMAIINLVSTH